MKRHRWLVALTALAATTALFAVAYDAGQVFMGVGKFPCDLATAACVVALVTLAARGKRRRVS